ncbi:hypothetical protein AB205_0170940, partial [Aquarana catesbeiana]
IDNTGKTLSKADLRQLYLQEKYSWKWKQFLSRKGKRPTPVDLKLGHNNWLRQVLFTPATQSARQAACTIVEALATFPSRRQQVLDLLTSYLDELSVAGECAAEYLALYQKLIKPAHWKVYLAARGVLPYVGNLITKEIARLLALEEATLSTDLQQGYALKSLTGLLSSFVEVESIKRHFKSRLVGTVLNGYLCLRKLVVQRTKLIDETQDMLLEMLEDMTTGTESETKAFMAVCIETAKRYSLDDYRTPVFIFERLCSIIYPEENEVTEFFVTLEKDPQQEDFLQGRMPGNPYSSNEPGIGPLMRDIKNKICQDCDLVALLEDDSGMEGEPMRIIYRMRGLLGDATEEFIESLDSTTGSITRLQLYLAYVAVVFIYCVASQALIGTDSITNLHKLEQVSSDEGIGTLAENLLEALRENPDVNKKIDAARKETRAEKKRMAMAMRQKALGTLGMTVGD